jgi:hypothetical protein
VIGCNWDKSDVRKDSTTDTVYVKGKTINIRDTITLRDSFSYPVPKLVYAAQANDSSLCDSIREYTSSIDDSSGLVVVNSTVQGKLIKQDITLQVYKDSIFRTDTLKITTTKPRNIIAPFVTINQERAAAGFILSRGRNIYGLSYGTDQLINITYGWNLRK